MKKKSISTKYKEKLLERFLTYVKINTESDSESADKGNLPSTKNQWEMAKLLEKELILLGGKEVQITEDCYIYGYFPAKFHQNVKTMCLLAHIDTSEEVSGKNVKPILHKAYKGDNLRLNQKLSINIEENPDLEKCAFTDDTIITSSGDTLLGADDKAGLAEIITMLEYFNENPKEQVCNIEVIFSPDEETGHGMDKVPLNLIKSKYAYTVDGGNLGELETECFNAYKSEITFHGKSMHTGLARPNMVNAITMASSFITALPRNLSPETTDNYMGFYAPISIEGSIEMAKVQILLRDFSREGIEEKKTVINTIAKMIEKTFNSSVKVKHTLQYLNMKEELDKNPNVVENLVKAYEKAEISPVFTPIRGGTDGSRLTEMGIPCPNIFTGGHNFHSRFEWASLNQMFKALEVLIYLVKE